MAETITSTTVPYKEIVYDTYLDLHGLSSRLSGQIRAHHPGSKYVTFIHFEKTMVALFNLTASYKLNPVMIKKMNAWSVAKRKKKPSDKFMIKSINLFKEYSDELITCNIIRV